MLNQSHSRWAAAAVIGAVAATTGTAVMAQSVADFYRDRKVEFVVPAPAGGGYGLNARIITEHLSRHIPGNPTFVLNFIVGAGGVKAANYMYEVAAKDGSVIGMPNNANVLAEYLLQQKGLRFKSKEFTWLGTVATLTNVLAVRDGAGVNSVADMKAKEFVIGSTGKNSWLYFWPEFVKKTLGDKYRVVTGYSGARGLRIAMERKEIDGGAFHWQTLYANWADDVKSGSIIPIVQSAAQKDPDLPNVPRVIDLLDKKEHKQMARLFHSITTIGRTIYAPPGVPPERAAALRQAVDELVKDPQFLADMRSKGQDVRPANWKELETLINEISDTPDSVINDMRAMLGYAQS